MTRRSLPFLATFLAIMMLLLAAAPAFGYGHVNHYHLRLTRLDSLRCGRPIAIEAKLTDHQGNRISGKTIDFAITKGKPGDTLSPSSAVTNARGKAVTFVTLACVNGKHRTKIVATGPNGAKARITLVLTKHHHWRHDRDRHDSSAILPSTVGSGGTGQGAITAASSTDMSPVASTSPAPTTLSPVGVLLLGSVIALLAVVRRRLSPRPEPSATD